MVCFAAPFTYGATNVSTAFPAASSAMSPTPKPAPSSGSVTFSSSSDTVI